MPTTTKSTEDIIKELATPFAPEDLAWRVQSSGEGNNGIWAMVLVYMQSRAVMDRLDAVLGATNWQTEFTDTGNGLLCGLSLRIDGEWITKWDGASLTAVEPFKGGVSDALKRAAVQWGIGRYLYQLEATWATISENGKYRAKLKNNGTAFKWTPPNLPAWAVPEGSGGNGNASNQNAPEPPPPPPPSVEPTPHELQGRALFNASKAAEITVEDLPKLFTAILEREIESSQELSIQDMMKCQEVIESPEELKRFYPLLPF